MKALYGLLLIPFVLFAAHSTNTLNLTLNHSDRVATKIILYALNSIGQRVSIHRYEREDQRVFMEIRIEGSKEFESKYFGEIIRDSGLSIIKASVQKNVWNIELEGSQARWNLSEITPDEGSQMEKGTSASWFIVDRSRAITIEAPYNGKWYPDVAVLDANMEVLSSLREFKSQESLTFSLPEGAMYLKVSSVNGMKLLKEGMWIEHTQGER